MKRVLIPLATGFEETEAIGTIDLLRRAGLEVTTASITNDLMVTGAHGIIIMSDKLLSSLTNESYDAIVLPGGMPGATNLADCAPLCEMIQRQNSAHGLLAAICAAPLVFGRLGLLQGKRATCYPGFESELTGAQASGEAVVEDQHIITAKGPGFVFDYALSIITKLVDKATATSVAEGLLLR